MITLTWGNVRDQNFMTSLGTVCAKPVGYDVGMKIALIGREIKKQQKLLDETHEGVLKKYGTPIEGQPGRYNIKPETRKEYDAEMAKIDAHEFTVKVNKLDPKELSEQMGKLAPQDLILLEPLLKPLEGTPLAAVPNEAKPATATPPAPH